MRRLFMFEEVYVTGDKENNTLRKRSTTKLFQSLKGQELEGEDDESYYELESESSNISELIERNKAKDKLAMSFNLSSLTCEDVLFAIFDESLRKIEPIIHKFYCDEAMTINQLSLNLSYYEQLDFVRRSHMASKMMIYLTMDVHVKNKFYKSILESTFSYPKLKVLVQLL